MKRLRTKGLKKALQKEKDQNLLDEDLGIKDRIAMEINKDKECWLGKVNRNIEKLIYKDNMENQLLSHMAHHYQTRNKICNINVKKM